MNTVTIPVSFLEVFLPSDVLQWFDIVSAEKQINIIAITLEEKNNPPLPSWYNGEPIESKGFKDITITDFPIRGKKTLLIFRRRCWKIEGYDVLLKRVITLKADGTLLEKEFGAFLKE